MKTHTAVAMALLSMSVLAGLAAVPVQAVDPDCDDPFNIADTEASANDRPLAVTASEVGVEDALALTGDEDVTVRLLTPGAELEFGIFVLDGQTCERATTVSPVQCESDVVLDMKDEEQECTIEAPGLGDEDYFFHVENNGTKSLEYKVFVST